MDFHSPVPRITLPLMLLCVSFVCHAQSNDCQTQPLIEFRNETKDKTPLWSIRFLSGVATNNSLGQIAMLQVNRLLETQVYGLELGRVLKSDVHDLPLDISANIGLMYHQSEADPSGVFQCNSYVKFEWTAFPWNDSVRTRVGFGEGISMVNEITYSENIRRMGKGSKKLLNYLDFSLSLNVADLGRITQLKKLFENDWEWLEETWLVGNVSHRSGIRGTYGNSEGEDGRKYPVTGGDNVINVGIIHRL